MLAHLVVLINPVEGSPANLQPLLSRIQNESTTAFVPDLNNVQVNDGIDFVSAQLYQKVRERFLSDQPKFLSFIGHSVGGIYARIIIKRLADDDYLDTCIPLYFITIGTPHLGSKHWFKGIFADLILGPREKELMLLSNNSKEPLLMRIIDDKHLNALKKFKYLVAYSSSAGDSPYSMESTSIRTHEQLLGLETNGILLNSSLSMEYKETAFKGTESYSGKSRKILKALCSLNWFRIEFSGHMMHTLDFWSSEGSEDLMEHLTQLISNPTIDITTNFENPRDGIHLVVLIHGLEGFNTDFQYLACKLRERFSGRVKTLSPDCNHGRTGDGIMNGAKRILECIEIEIKKSSVVYLSLIGHSLGGLYARCVAGLLNQKGLFQSRLIPLNFITLATPHLGSREHTKILGSKFTSLLAEVVVGQTGKGI